MNPNLINFTAVDFETATSDKMICQAGIVVVRDGKIVEKLSKYIQPPGNEYSANTIRVHHITPEDTEPCDTFDKAWCDISKYFMVDTIVAHNAPFDRTALYRNLEYYGISDKGIGDFKCTYEIYGLNLHDLCLEFGINPDGHHDAMFDAECCAKFYINYLTDTKPEDYIDRDSLVDSGFFHKQLHGDILKKDLTSANPDNPFYDKRVVITGIFNMDRQILAEKIKSLGADINVNITKNTDYVLVGVDPGPRKIQKIENLICEGYDIRVLFQRELMDILRKYT